MNSCFDKFNEREIKRKRIIRLQQVREQDKILAQQALQRTAEEKARRKADLQAKQKKAFEEYKKELIEKLEKEYEQAMAEVGLALELSKPKESEEARKEREKRNRVQAEHRGKVAMEKELQRRQEEEEREEARIRRLQTIRGIEDIRAALVVQSRDWEVINQPYRPALVDVSQNTVEQTSRMQSVKSPKSRRTPRADPRPYPTVPRLAEDFEDMPSSTGRTSRRSPLKTVRRRTEATYRVPDRTDPERESDLLPPRNPSPGQVIEDDELDRILERYHPEMLSPPKERTTSPCQNKSQKHPQNFTPPTRDKEPKISKSKITRKRSSIKRPFAEFDRVLEECRQIRELSSSCRKTESSDSEIEAIVNVIVNVNCNQEKDDPDSPEKNVEMKNASTEVGESLVSENKPEPTSRPCSREAAKNLQMRSIATEVGESLMSQTEATTTCSGTVECSSIQEPCSQRPRPGPCIIHLVQEPLQRTSTVSDLRDKQNSEELNVDLSSIHEETRSISGSSIRRRKSDKKIKKRKSERTAHLRPPTETWSSTEYLDVPDAPDQRTLKQKFETNPILDYYIRKLLDMRVKGSSEECCPCPSKQNTRRDPHVKDAVPSASPRKESSPKNQVDKAYSSTANESQPNSQEDHNLRDMKIEEDRKRREKLLEENEQRRKKIMQLYEVIAQARKDQEVLLSYSETHSSESSSHATGIGSDLSKREHPTQAERHGSLHLPPDLSTIMEVDSRLHVSATTPAAASNLDNIPDPVKFLLDRKLIHAPFKWCLNETSSSNEAGQTLRKTNVSPSPTVQSELKLDFSSLLSESSASRTKHENFMANLEDLDTDAIINRARQDLAEMYSRLDVSSAKGV